MRLDKARGRVLTCENLGKENDFILYQKISNGRNTAFGVVNEFSKLEFGKEYDKINVETVAFDTAILN